MHAHIYTMHKRRLRWNFHVSPPNLSWEKCGTVSSKNQGVVATWWTVPNADRNLSEFRFEAEEMVCTIAIIAKQDLISIVCPLTYLTWIVKWRNPSWHDDGRIQVWQMAGRIIFGVILNCAFVSSLQLQHTWRLDRLNPQDNATGKSVQSTIMLSLEIHKVTNIKLSHLKFITATSCVCIP
jgi:hypothetical protein